MKCMLQCQTALKGIQRLLMKNQKIYAPIVQRLYLRSFLTASSVKKRRTKTKMNIACGHHFMSKQDFSLDLSRYTIQMDDGNISLQFEILFEKLSDNTLDEFESLEHRNKLASILYDLYSQNDLRFLLYFLKMHEYNVLTESAYRIMMRYLAEQNDLVNLNRVMKMLKNDKNVTILSRSYIPSIIAYLLNSDPENSLKLLNEMIFVMGTHFKSNNFAAIVQTCVDVRQNENYDSITEFMNELLRIFQGFGSDQLDVTLLDALLEWFRKDPKFKWSIKKTELHPPCLHCDANLTATSFKTNVNNTLKENVHLYIKSSLIRCIKHTKDLRANRKLHMNRYYQEMLSEAISKSLSMSNVLRNEINGNKNLLSRHHSSRTLTKLDTLLILNGPFHIVVDALNIINQLKFVLNKNRLKDTEVYVEFKDVIDVFIQQRKHILIIWPDFLKSKLTNTMKDQNADPTQRNVFGYLKQHCYFFNADSSLTDDLFILYTLQHSNFKTQLLSCDHLRDHMNFLDVENRIDCLHWQRDNQFFIESKMKGRFPVLQTGKAGRGNRSVIHFNDGRWHFVGEDCVYCVSPHL